MEKPLPFRIVKDDATPLVRQVADGLRTAVLGGYYSPGDRLPSFDAMAKMLGVSRIVTKEAFRRVAAEGLLASRERLGTFVRDTSEKRWLGHVVFVGFADDGNFFQSVFSGVLRDTFMEAGYFFTEVHLRRKAGDGKSGCSSLDYALSRSVDLAITCNSPAGAISLLAERKVPFVYVADSPRKPAGAVGLTRFDRCLAIGGFVGECLRQGIREVVEFCWEKQNVDVGPACRKAGISVEKIVVRSDVTFSPLLNLQRAGMNAFAKAMRDPAFETGNPRRLYFFNNDFLASGALLALSRAGLEAPGDIRVATWANAGLGPVYHRELSRMEMDPFAAGSTVASAALEYLNTGKYPKGAVIGPKWVAGETL